MSNSSKDIYIPEIEDLHRMKKQEIEKFSECATLAYKEYPLFKYLTNGRFEHNVIKTIISASIKGMQKDVIGVSLKDNDNAIALFLPPDYKGSSAIPFLIGGGLKLLCITPIGIFARLLRYENYAMALKKKYTKHKCWYLYNVTVKPEYQNNGMSSKLLKPMFKYLDRIGQDCYLETHKEENVKIYEHYGFELLETSKIPKTEIVQYSMLRKAKKMEEENE